MTDNGDDGYNDGNSINDNGNNIDINNDNNVGSPVVRDERTCQAKTSRTNQLCKRMSTVGSKVR